MKIVVECNLAADHAAIGGEPAPPQRVAQDDDVRPIVLIIRCVEATSQKRLHAENAKVICADALAFESLGLPATDHRRLPGLEGGNGFEGVVAFVHSMECAEANEFGGAISARLP